MAGSDTSTLHATPPRTVSKVPTTTFHIGAVFVMYLALWAYVGARLGLHAEECGLCYWILFSRFRPDTVIRVSSLKADAILLMWCGSIGVSKQQCPLIIGFFVPFCRRKLSPIFFTARFRERPGGRRFPELQSLVGIASRGSFCLLHGVFLSFPFLGRTPSMLSHHLRQRLPLRGSAVHKLPYGILVTVDAKRFRCEEILSQPVGP